MKIIIAAAVAIGTLVATTAWAQQCRPGQSVRCTNNFGTVTCSCAW